MSEIQNCFVKVPDFWRYDRPGKQGKKHYPVTITLNVKNPQYRALNCPSEFKSMLNSFLDLKKYKHLINGVLEYHKKNGALRDGGLHMHGFVYNRNPPRDNYSNLFHFHMSEPDEIKGVKGYIKYSKKDLEANEKRFRELASKPIEDIILFGDSPVIRPSKCLFDD